MTLDQSPKWTSELVAVPDYFKPETLKNWANEIAGCDGKHDSQSLLSQVRMITLNPTFLQIIRAPSTDYLIPDASWQQIRGISGSIPRGFIMDVIAISEIMAYSRIVGHGLSEDELASVYKHHCIELLVRSAPHWQLSIDEGLLTLGHYIKRSCYRFKS